MKSPKITDVVFYNYLFANGADLKQGYAVTKVYDSKRARNWAANYFRKHKLEVDVPDDYSFGLTVYYTDLTSRIKRFLKNV